MKHKSKMTEKNKNDHYPIYRAPMELKIKKIKNLQKKIKKCKKHKKYKKYKKLNFKFGCRSSL